MTEGKKEGKQNNTDTVKVLSISPLYLLFYPQRILLLNFVYIVPMYILIVLLYIHVLIFKLGY